MFTLCCSWKEGHKHGYVELKDAYERFKRNKACIRRAVQDGVYGCANPIRNYDTVFEMAWLMAAIFPLFLTLEQFPPGLFYRLKDPTMDVFFENVRFILSGGDHWLFGDTPDPTFATKFQVL